ncbi:hypothetical protein GQX73_g3807 [Xylaria multiplex]|uniref:Adenine deaminase n=1 Tax=Xylaria multiplex TaxID=323545 RepID=A0A7C8IQH8_9PEZI|nr:hypothetical protein GQX73_g3807 [Xylaria multiplex]
MCKSSLHDFLVAVPKVENHLHVEGTLEPAMLFAFAARNHVELPKEPEWANVESLKARYSKFTCLDDFLRYIYLGASVLVKAADFEELAWAYFVKAASMRVRHVEVSFDPQMHTVRGVSYDVIVEGLMAAKRRAVKQLGMTIEYIACIHRHLPLADSTALVDVILERRHLTDGTICGVGLVSSEKPFPPVMFADLFKRVAPTGTKLTAHVGEEVGPEAVREALQCLNVSRVDHGLTAAQDPKLLEELARSRTLLTLCPWSNVALGILPELSQSPVRRFLDAGVRFSINSDDPAYDGAYLQDVYCRVQDTFNLTLEEWDWIVRGGIEGSWVGEERMKELLSEYNVVFEQFKTKAS